MTLTRSQRKIASSVILASTLFILFSINSTYTTTEGDYSNDNNFLTDVYESTHTENGYTANIIVNPHISGTYSKENGYGLDLSINPAGIGGLHEEGNYKLDLIPEKSFPEQSNLRITNITVCKTIVGQGYLLHINVTIENQAYMPEEIKVTAYTDTTPIQTQTITLTSRELTTVTFTWDTTGTAKAEYTVSAYTHPVAGETITVDNTKTGDNIKVTIPGDITGDNKVNILDIYTLGKAYGSTPSNSNWNPNANINCDGTINNPDLTTVCTNYGNH
jgi:hypothetical protein